MNASKLNEKGNSNGLPFFVRIKMKEKYDNLLSYIYNILSIVSKAAKIVCERVTNEPLL